MATAMDSSPTYVMTTPPPESDLSLGSVELPWWADLIDADELADVIRNQCDEKVLLIDCRSFIDFNQSNVVNSINVCCNKIVKRRLQQNKLKIQEFLSSTCHIEIDGGYMVVIYDNTTTDASVLPEDNIVAILGNKCSKVFCRVRVLYGGFLEFQAQHPSLLETKTRTAHQQATASLSQPCLPVTNIGPTKILPYLFLGSMKDALNAELAKANGITYVLNVSMTCPKPVHIQDGHFLRIPVNDNYSEKLLPYFHEAFQFIDKVRESGGCVLVHCLAGVSRSPTLAIAYIMRCYHMVSEDAYRYVKEKRVAISPNFNFLGQLLEYEQQMDREDSSNFAGSKRRCIDDLRAELSTPGSPVATPKIPKSISLDNKSLRLNNAQSPTTALSKLRFEHCISVPQGAHSPTAAFAKLKFGGITDNPKPQATYGQTDVEFMQCYSPDTIHQNTSATNSPSDANPSKPSTLHILNSNCNNSNAPLDASRSPSPNSLRPSRPGSLKLIVVDEIGGNEPAEILQEVKVEERLVSKTDQLTLAMEEARRADNQSVAHISQETFKQPDRLDTASCGVVLREPNKQKDKVRPRSVTLSETTSAVSSSDSLPSAHTASESIDKLIKIGGSQAKSRSLEDILHVVDSVTAASSTASITSTGSHSSLHGSLEIIKVL